MSRPPRMDYPGAHHHVMNRGAHHRRIFHASDDRWLFLGLLREVEARHGVQVRAYALMPNHFHLLVVSDSGQLSQAMQDLQGRYAGEIHRRSRRDGPMFRGRFRSRLVEDAAYWRHLFAYVHLNPHRLNPSRVEHPLWTSHGFFERGAGWLHTDDTLASLGGLAAYLEYLEAVRSLRFSPPGFDPNNLWGAERWSRKQACQTLAARGFDSREIAAALHLPWARVANQLAAQA
ncbi:MAG: hypothetical protein EP330_31070 [Deltaproteobacteria bacterium]|nr:MAG: hypothetical protein EP330_31070 [Deltaproteobacteria bacterium]